MLLGKGKSKNTIKNKIIITLVLVGYIPFAYYVIESTFQEGKKIPRNELKRVALVKYMKEVEHYKDSRLKTDLLAVTNQRTSLYSEANNKSKIIAEVDSGFYIRLIDAGDFVFINLLKKIPEFYQLKGDKFRQDDLFLVMAKYKIGWIDGNNLIVNISTIELFVKIFRASISYTFPGISFWENIIIWLKCILYSILLTVILFYLPFTKKDIPILDLPIDFTLSYIFPFMYFLFGNPLFFLSFPKSTVFIQYLFTLLIAVGVSSPIDYLIYRVLKKLKSIKGS